MTSFRFGRRHVAYAFALAVACALLFVRARRSREAAAPRETEPPAPRAAAAVDGPSPARHALSGPAWYVRRDATIRIEGRVFEDGAPRPGIPVTAVDALTDGGLLPARVAITDRDGRFSFAEVTKIAGSYRVFAETPAHATATASPPGDVSTTDLELRIEPCLTVYGVVSDASGGTVAAATVAFDGSAATVTTDAAGRYALCAGRRGKLRVTAASYAPWVREIEVRGRARQDVSLAPNARLRGSVVSAERGDAVPFALVSVTSAESRVDVLADADGRFAIDTIAPGSYRVSARVASARSKAPVDVAVFALADADVVVPIEARTSVRGRVVSDGGPRSRARVSFGYMGPSNGPPRCVPPTTARSR